MKSRAVVCILWAIFAVVWRSDADAGEFDRRLVSATVKLTAPNSIGTGFLLTRPGAEGQAAETILVTAAHVFESAQGPELTLGLRELTPEGTYRKLPHAVPIRQAEMILWTRHAEADVAALKVALPPQALASELPVELLADDDAFQTLAIGPGDLIRCAGYPHQEEANEAGFPLVRLGCIASFPLLPTRTIKTYYIDLNIFEGDSGGPVYQPAGPPTGDASAPRGPLILGLVHGQRFLDEEVRTLYTQSKTRYRFGLAVVVPSTFIKDTIAMLPPP